MNPPLNKGSWWGSIPPALLADLLLLGGCSAMRTNSFVTLRNTISTTYRYFLWKTCSNVNMLLPKHDSTNGQGDKMEHKCIRKMLRFSSEPFHSPTALSEQKMCECGERKGCKEREKSIWRHFPIMVTLLAKNPSVEWSFFPFTINLYT